MKMSTLLLAAFIASETLAEDDGKLTIAIPSSVQAVIAREKGGAGIISHFQKVNEPDGTTYLIGISLDGKKWDLSLDASGRVMRKRLDTGDGAPRITDIGVLPANVRTSMQREAGTGVIGEVEIIEQKTRYIAQAKEGTRRYRIEVDADGVLVSKDFIGDEEEP